MRLDKGMVESGDSLCWVPCRRRACLPHLASQLRAAEAVQTVQDEIMANTSLSRFSADIFEAVLASPLSAPRLKASFFDFCAAARFAGRGASHIARPNGTSAS